ncbi:MAG: glycosyltransferase [Acaryochloris sp. RU_4_1]|nr:glycosyltransferase [Acaryochloris sp. RU_4_1]NJR53977.1 glycosyltransferase [Acaryochloris sp. CRU_2_0]
MDTDQHHATTYIVIPVHNRKAITLKCLQNLQQNGNLEHLKVVVIDDGSTDNTGESICTQYPYVTLLKGDGNLWWTGAIALGMEYAYTQGAEYIIWLNDDCELLPETIPSLVQFCQATPGAIVGAQGFSKNQPDQLAFGGKRKTWQGYRYIQAEPNQISPCDLLSGNIVCIPRTVVDKMGYPNIQQTPHYGGDSLYLLRAQKAGFKIFVDGRYPALSMPGESFLYPSNWLASNGDPGQLWKLVFNPYSGLSWRLWLRLNWEAYSLWGCVMFLKKYTSIALITVLRYCQHFFSPKAQS